MEMLQTLNYHIQGNREYSTIQTPNIIHHPNTLINRLGSKRLGTNQISDEHCFILFLLLFL